MIELKCPFCQQEYIITKDDFCFGQQRCVCRNPNCEFDGWHFPVKLVSELIRTRKALDVAVDALKDCEKILKADRKDWGYLTAKVALNQIEALAEITALEQKE